MSEAQALNRLRTALTLSQTEHRRQVKGKSERHQTFSRSSPVRERMVVGGEAPGGKGQHTLSPSAFALNLAPLASGRRDLMSPRAGV